MRTHIYKGTFTISESHTGFPSDRLDECFGRCSESHQLFPGPENHQPSLNIMLIINMADWAWAYTSNNSVLALAFRPVIHKSCGSLEIWVYFAVETSAEMVITTKSGYKRYTL